MKTLKLLIFMSLFLSYSFAQTLEEPSFSQLISFFKNSNNQSLNKLGNADFILNKYFAITLSTMQSQAYTKTIIEYDTFYGFWIKIPCGAGGYCENQYFITIKKDGTFIDRIEIGHNMSHMGGSDIAEGIIHDDIIEITINRSKGYTDSDGKFAEKKLRTKYTYYKISTLGSICEIITPQVNSDRNFPSVVSRMLSENELKNLSINDLSIMRNEILAGKGYIFKSAKWQTHFSKYPWYKPKYQNVDALLNEIEKYNLLLILQAEDQRN